MSMHRFAGAGPIMSGLAAFTEADCAANEVPMFALSNEDLARMIENIADQLSEVAAQNVELRQRLDKLEGDSDEPWVLAPIHVGGIDGSTAQFWSASAHLERQAQQRATFAGASASPRDQYHASLRKLETTLTRFADLHGVIADRCAITDDGDTIYVLCDDREEEWNYDLVNDRWVKA